MLLLHTWLSGEALQVQFHLCIAAVLLCTAQRETCRRWICTGPTVELPLAQLHVHTVNLLVLTRYCDPLVPRLASWWQVTKLKLKQKQKEGIAEARSGRRSPVSSSAYVPCCATYLTPRGKYSGRRTIAILQHHLQCALATVSHFTTKRLMYMIQAYHLMDVLAVLA